jgi:hypothetical protein
MVEKTCAACDCDLDANSIEVTKGTASASRAVNGMPLDGFGRYR